jgi:DNA-binding Xre family transcriptional regulator
MEDYKIQLKVQNGHLFRMMESRGLKTVAELSRATGIDQVELGKIANLKKVAYTRGGKLILSYEKLCAFFFCDIADLVPEQHIANPLITSVTESYVTKDQLTALEIDSVNPSLMIDKDLISVESILDKSPITDRQRDIIRWRFEDGKTYKEIGSILSLSTARCREIEQAAFRKMRQPKCKLSESMDIYMEEAI